MGIADELQKLDELHRKGTLTNEEFVQAKSRLLATPIGTSLEAGALLQDQLTEVRHQNELARIDSEWEIERRQYEIRGRYGTRYVPTYGTVIATVVSGGIIGAFLAAAAYAMNIGISSFSEHGISIPGFNWRIPVNNAILPILPWIGIGIAVLSIGTGLYRYLLVNNHHAAFAAYQSRREKVSADFQKRADCAKNQ
jgi:hypothetical protein